MPRQKAKPPPIAKVKETYAHKKKTTAKKTTTKKKVVAKKKDETLVKLPTRRQLRNMEAKRRFIEALAHCGTINKACKIAGISPTTYYLWTDPKVAEHYGLDPKHYDPEFHAASHEAYHNRFQDRVTQTGIDRALDGWTDFHYDRNGNLVREEFKYDSPVLQMLMKKADPALKDKQGDIHVDARNQTLNVNAQSAAVLDSLTPRQKKLLLEAAALAPTVDDKDSGTSPEVIEGQVMPQEIKDVVN